METAKLSFTHMNVHIGRLSAKQSNYIIWLELSNNYSPIIITPPEETGGTARNAMYASVPEALVQAEKILSVFQDAANDKVSVKPYTAPYSGGQLAGIFEVGGLWFVLGKRLENGNHEQGYFNDHEQFVNVLDAALKSIVFMDPRVLIHYAFTPMSIGGVPELPNVVPASREF